MQGAVLVTHYLPPGLDPKHRQLLFFKSSTESRQDVLRLPPSAVQTLGQLEIRTDFTDVHLYIFDRQAVTELLDQRSEMTSIKQVGCLVREISVLPL